MDDRSHLYIGTAFVAGVLLTLGFKDLVYPELERRVKDYYYYQASSQEKTAATSEDALSARLGPPAIVEGIEGCIGNTPLFRIKSLSDATGCEILGKAEVRHSTSTSSILSLH